MTTASPDEFFAYALGLNYFVKGYEVQQLPSYERTQYDTKAANNELIAAMQVWY